MDAGADAGANALLNHYDRLQSVLGLAATLELAQDILRSPVGETARAFVRGDLYVVHPTNLDSQGLVF
jgi:hypothetical protein